MAAKKKEVNVLTKMLEEKLERSGALAVEMKNDLGDTAEGFEEDKKFLTSMGRNCVEKTKLHEENVRCRTSELAKAREENVENRTQELAALRQS